jgi:putative hemolysin
MEVYMIRRACMGLLVLIVVLSAACTPTPAGTTSQADIANPASVFCEQFGGRLEMRTGADGGVVGVCLFSDGSECDEWAYFRGGCHPGDSLITPGSQTSAPASIEPAGDGWNVYHSDAFGYSFRYPEDAQIEFIDDPLHSISIIGPEQDGERWPQISISHPSDRADYRPPEGTNLAQWLTDNYLFGDTRLPDVQIAGTTAIHLRHDRSPQTYAYDRYYFARAGQLYMVLINHAGDKEDWQLYNHFLENLRFDS